MSEVGAHVVVGDAGILELAEEVLLKDSASIAVDRLEFHPRQSSDPWFSEK